VIRRELWLREENSTPILLWTFKPRRSRWIWSGEGGKSFWLRDPLFPKTRVGDLLTETAKWAQYRHLFLKLRVSHLVHNKYNSYESYLSKQKWGTGAVVSMGWTTGVRLPAGARISFLRHRVQTGSEVDPASYPMGTGGSFRREMRLPVHSPLSIADVKNAWTYTSTPPYVFMTWCLVTHLYLNTSAL
jgi:hypothetical protein